MRHQEHYTIAAGMVGGAALLIAGAAIAVDGFKGATDLWFFAGLGSLGVSCVGYLIWQLINQRKKMIALALAPSCEVCDSPDVDTRVSGYRCYRCEFDTDFRQDTAIAPHLDRLRSLRQGHESLVAASQAIRESEDIPLLMNARERRNYREWKQTEALRLLSDGAYHLQETKDAGAEALEILLDTSELGNLLDSNAFDADQTAAATSIVHQVLQEEKSILRDLFRGRRSF